MSVYVYSTPDGAWPKDYDPVRKTELLRRHLLPLIEVYNVDDKQAAIFVIKIV